MKKICLLNKFLLLSIAIFIFSGCDERLMMENKGLQDEIKALKSKIDLIEIHDKFQNSRNAEFHKRLFSLENTIKDSVEIDFAGKGFSRIDTNLGFLLISFRDVQSFADGAKVTLLIGNPLSMSYEGFRVKAEWGKRQPILPADPKDSDIEKDVKNWEEWEKSIQKKEFDFSETLKSGFWNKITLILPNTKINELGYLQISLRIKTIGLTIGKE